MLALARCGTFGSRLVPVLLRMNANFPPRRPRKRDIIVLCGLLDVRERQCTICIRDVDDLIEPGDSIAHVLRIGQRLLPLLRKGINRVRQVALRRKLPMFLVRFPSRTHLDLLTPASQPVSISAFAKTLDDSIEFIGRSVTGRCRCLIPLHPSFPAIKRWGYFW